MTEVSSDACVYLSISNWLFFDNPLFRSHPNISLEDCDLECPSTRSCCHPYIPWELNDARRSALLSAGHVGNYIRRGRGGIYLRSTDNHGPSPLRLVEVAARAKPRYFQPAVRLVASVPMSEMSELIEAVPENRMSAEARWFAN